MRMFFICSLLFVAGSLMAQADSSQTVSIAPTYTSMHTLNREDIQRLPAVHLMEVLQGAFPFVGNESVFEEDYCFLVNGFVLTNPDAINLSQIESISFYPAGTALTRGSLGKKGTFIIRTSPEKTGFNFSIKTGMTDAKKYKIAPLTDISGAENGFYTQDEVSYGYKGQDGFVSSAFSFLKDKNPTYRIGDVSAVTNTSSALKRYRLSNFAAYQFDPHWKLEGGLLLTAQPQTAERDRNYGSGSFAGRQLNEVDRQVNFTNAYAGFLFSPSAKFDNQFMAEASRYKDGQESVENDNDNSSGYTYLVNTTFLGRYTSWAFSDRFSWKPVLSSAIHLELALLARYRQIRWTEKDQYVYSGTGSGAGAAIWNLRAKSFLLSPDLSLNWKDILYAEAGASYDDYGSSWYGPNKEKSILPHAGLRLELASLLKTPALSSLELSANYNQHLTSYERYDREEIGFRPFSPTQVFSGSIPVSNFQDAYKPVKTWLASVALGVLNNRLLLKAQYRNHERRIRSVIYAPIGGGQPGTINLIEPLTGKGLAFEMSASVIDNASTKWKIYATIFQDKYEREFSFYPPTPIDYVLLDAGKAPLRGGLKTSVSLKRFFIQASALISFDEQAFDKNGNLQPDLDRYDCNYLLLGYQLPLKRGGIKSLEINAQTRNLFYTPGYAIEKYVGLGATLGF